jgi:predicted ATP-dependent serine protease
MRKQYRVKHCNIKPRKFNGKCEDCGKTIDESEAFRYVDESNYSITVNSPYLCKECYNKQYWNDQKP